MHGYLLDDFTPPPGSSTRSRLDQYQTYIAFLYAIASALSELYLRSHRICSHFCKPTNYCILSSHLQPAHSNWDADFLLTPIMRENRFAIFELKPSRFAIGLCWELPCGLLLCLKSCPQMQQTDNLQSWENQFQTRVCYQSGIACYNICFSLKEIIFKCSNPLNGQSHRSLTRESYGRN